MIQDSSQRLDSLSVPALSTRGVLCGVLRNAGIVSVPCASHGYVSLRKPECLHLVGTLPRGSAVHSPAVASCGTCDRRLPGAATRGGEHDSARIPSFSCSIEPGQGWERPGGADGARCVDRWPKCIHKRSMSELPRLSRFRSLSDSSFVVAADSIEMKLRA